MSEPAAPSRADRGPAVGHFGFIVVGASLMALLAAVLWPQASELVLRILLATLACVYVLLRALGAGLPEAMTHDEYSPFQGRAAGAGVRATPLVVRGLADDLGAADDPRRIRRTEIPWSVGRTVAREAARRLAEHHDLHLHDPADHAAIRRRVSEPTWLLIEPAAGAPSKTVRGGPGMEERGTNTIGSVPLSRLEGILDELESL